MERWRIFGLTTLLCVAFLASLFLIAEAGRVRLRDASESMQAALARHILVGELRRQVAESALRTRSFVLTGRPEYLHSLRTSSRDINRTADAVVTSYVDEPAGAAETARQLRHLAGMQAGATLSLVSLYTSRGAAAARELARAQAPPVDPLERFIAASDELERYERTRVTQTRANWYREQRQARQLALAGTLVTIVLVLSASLMALAALRRHREGMAQVERRKDELEHEAKHRAAELSEVYGHLQTVQEQERSRLARGLHDELGGLLLAARMDVTWVKQHAHDAPPAALAARIERVLDVLDQGIDLKRRVIEELRPTLLDNMGLLAAIQWQADETCKRGRLRCTCHFPAQEPAVDAQTAIALFRVVQEALNNVHKHADASRVDITLEIAADHVLLAIVDDGRGIGAGVVGKSQAHGLAGMKHRVVALGGTLTVGNSPEGGTEVRAFVPRGPVDRPRVTSPEARASAGSVSRLTGRG
jgi:signal transduction histidine kinase